jgi:hypothetical protein
VHGPTCAAVLSPQSSNLVAPNWLCSEFKFGGSKSVVNRSDPHARVEAVDKGFHAKIGNAAIERVCTGFRWCEGPVYFRDGGYLLWSDIPNDRIMR